MMQNLTATLRRIYMTENDGNGSDLGGAGALDIETRIANALSSGDEGADDLDETAVDDAGNPLPKASDVEPDEDVIDSNEDDATLASALGLDDDKLSYDEAGNVVFNATINGEVKQVSMNDLVKSYQLEGHVTQKSMQLESERREFAHTRDDAYNHLTQRIQAASNLLAMAEQSLTQEFQNIDWNTLRATDPGEWSAYRQYFTERMQQIETAKTQVAQSNQGITDEQKQQAAQQHAVFLQGEMQKMVADNPAWSDQTVMAKEVGEIGKFLNDSYGFTPDEIANNMDARLMRMIRDAQAYRSGKAALKDKQVPNNVPTFRKPNAQSNRADMQQARDAKKIKDDIRRSGGSQDAIAAALLKRM